MGSITKIQPSESFTQLTVIGVIGLWSPSTTQDTLSDTADILDISVGADLVTDYAEMMPLGMLKMDLRGAGIGWYVRFHLGVPIIQDTSFVIRTPE